MSTALPAALEAGEQCRIFASLYEGSELSIPDSAAILTARHIDLTDTVDFSAQAPRIASPPPTSTGAVDGDPLGQSQREELEQERLRENQRRFEHFGAIGGQSVCFDRVCSGPTRATDLVESLLPFALSVGSSIKNSSVLFVNNLGAAESPFHAVHRGETSVLYQVLAAMVPWMRRRSVDVDATLVAWDAWGDTFDLFANNRQEEEHLQAMSGGAGDASSSGAATTCPAVFTGRDRLFDQLNVNRIVAAQDGSGPAAAARQRGDGTPLSRAGMLVTAGGAGGQHHHQISGLSSRYKTVPELSDFVERKVAAFRKQIAAGAFSKDTSLSGGGGGGNGVVVSSSELRYAVSLRLDLVPTGVDANDELTWGSLTIVECSGAMLCQARSSRRGFSPSLLSTIRSMFLPPGHEPVGWIATTSTSARVADDGGGATAAVPSSAPLQCLSELPQRPELSLACAVLGPTCNSRVAMVLPLSTVCYGSSALFVQACVDAACLARREWITFPDRPPPLFFTNGSSSGPGHSEDMGLQLFNFSYESLAREVTALRWQLRRHRNCKLRDVGAGDAPVLQDDDDNMRRGQQRGRGTGKASATGAAAVPRLTSASAGYPNAVPIFDDSMAQHRSSGSLGNDSFAGFSTTNDSFIDAAAAAAAADAAAAARQSALKAAGEPASNANLSVSFLLDKKSVASSKQGPAESGHGSGGGGNFSIPAIDAWIIAMRRRLESLEEVEAEQQEWQAWLEDYREWLLSVPASGPSTQTILVPTAAAAAAGGANANAAAADGGMMKMTISWPERCELLERIVAQQQDELRRLKRICARDIENLREEVALLRGCHSAAGGGGSGSGRSRDGGARPPAMLVTVSGAVDGGVANNSSGALFGVKNTSSLGGGGGGVKGGNVLGQQQQQPDNSVAHFTELRSVLQHFEFDVLALRNNAALPPEEAAFEVQAMVDRLAHDVDAIVKPLIHESNSRGIKQRAHQLVVAAWEMPPPPPDHQALFRHERLRLRALAGALARGCDDLAARISAAVDALTEASILQMQQQERAGVGGAAAPAVSIPSAQQQMDEFSRVNDAAGFLALSSKSNNATSAASAASGPAQRGGGGGKKPLIEPDQSSMDSRAAAMAARYSHFVLSRVHQTWCRNVAVSLRNSAEGVAQHLDRDIDVELQRAAADSDHVLSSSGAMQDAAIAELCARFFSNRATRVIAGKQARDRKGALEDETTALSRVLSETHKNAAAAASAADGTPAKAQHQLSGQQRVTSVNLGAITGKDSATVANLRSRFKKGLFSSEAAAAGGIGGGARSLTPRPGRR